MDSSRVGAMDHHHLRNVAPVQQGKLAFQGGLRVLKTLTAKVEETLGTDPPTGAVINPWRLANGETNPAQSVVMTSSRRTGATIWMERVA